MQQDPLETSALLAGAFALIAEQFLSQLLSQTLTQSPPIEALLHINVNPAHQDYQINGGPVCYNEQNHALSPAAARRLACDCSARSVVEDNDGDGVNLSPESS